MGGIALIALARKMPLAGRNRVVIFGFFAAAGIAEALLGGLVRHRPSRFGCCGYQPRAAPSGATPD